MAETNEITLVRGAARCCLAVGRVYPHVEKWLQYYNGALGDPITLEGGCGSGQYAQFFKDGRYFSFDKKESWYDKIREPTVYASSDNLPFKNEEFEFSFSVAAFDYFPNPVKSLSEIYRCLKPGGRFVVFTYDLNTLKKIHAGALEMADSPVHINHHIYSKKKLYHYAKEAGFKVRELPTFPDSSIWERIKAVLRPSYLRNYEFRRPN